MHTVTLLKKTHLTPTLFLLTTSRPEGYRFEAGQFARLGVDGTMRAYSLLSAPMDETLEFFITLVPQGELTSQLVTLSIGDTLALDPKAYGFLTLSRFSDAKEDLWMFATGTGVAPFLSILRTDTWHAYKRITLVYSVRHRADLLVGTSPDPRVRFVPILTGEGKARIPQMLDAFDPSSKAHILLCGNPAMIEETKEALKKQGFAMHRRGQGNIAVESYW